nr:YlxR family protein [Mobilicoccus caccae]
MRTCLGCRRRDARSSLLRLVAEVTRPSPATVAVKPDPGRRLPGRGAWIHPTTVCLDQAVRRRAVGRALRLTVGVNLDEVRDHIEMQEAGAGSGDEHGRPAG